MQSNLSFLLVAILFTVFAVRAFVFAMAVKKARLRLVAAALRRLASELGLDWWETDGPFNYDLARLTGSGRDAIVNVLKWKCANCDVLWFEEIVYKRKWTYYEPRVAVRWRGAILPRFVLARKTLEKNIQLRWSESSAAVREELLDGRYILLGEDLGTLNHLLNGRLREELTAVDLPPSMVVRGHREWLVLEVKGFRSAYLDPSAKALFEDVDTFFSSFLKAVSVAKLFGPIEADEESFKLPRMTGAEVPKPSRVLGDNVFVFAALALLLVGVVPYQVSKPDWAVWALEAILGVCLWVLGKLLSRAYSHSLSRAVESLAHGQEKLHL